MGKAKEWLSLGLAAISLIGALSTYAVLQYRVDQLEAEFKASDEKHDTLREKVTELVTEVRILLDRQARPPGPAAQPLPMAVLKAAPPPDPLQEDLDGLLERLRRQREGPQRIDPQPKPEQPPQPEGPPPAVDPEKDPPPPATTGEIASP